MYNQLYSIIAANLKWILPPFTLIFLFLFTYVWSRRHMYYHASKIPGPFAFPFIGSLHLVSKGHHGIHQFLKKLFKDYPFVVKMWMGPDLYVSTTQPDYLKVVLTQFLSKGNFYHLMSDYFHRALAAAPVDLWKTNRKNINPTFNVTLIHSFVDSFAKQANILADNLEESCGKETDDIFPIVWKCTLDSACETLCDVDPALLRSQDFFPKAFKLEEILMRRFFTPTLHLDIFWKLSSARKEFFTFWRSNCSFIQKIIDLRNESSDNDDTIKLEESEETYSKKRFLNHLIDLDNSNQLSHEYVLEEGQIMFFVGTETSTVAISSTLLVLGMYPEVQSKIDEELFSIFGNSQRSPTLEDVNRMDYLERVIKETLRLLPPIPFIIRGLDKDLQIGSYVFPKGANFIIPIAYVHRTAEFWPDPLKFDPDRFLPEEIEKRPPCSYLPFSYGIRNCIGYKYGMLSMKVILSTILRRYRVKSSNYKSIEDMDLFIHVVAKPKNGYKITLERKMGR